jgi:2-oxoglutarate ferredoxin oxidoreductase subunit gamma
MSQGAWTTYGKNIQSGGVLIIDEDLVKIDEIPNDVVLYGVPCTRIAESMGRKIVANIVMLGALAALGGVIDYESMKQSVLSSIPPGTEDLNVSAFDKGYEYARNLLSKTKTDRT